MIDVSAAQEIVLGHTQALLAETAAIAPSLLGQVLAEDVTSDIDMPPFDKALMDGFAIRSVDLSAGQAEFEVIEEILAGQTPQRSIGPGQAARIMTGAPLPSGADAVIMVERSEEVASNKVRLIDRPPAPGQNRLQLGREMRRGEIVLKAGTFLRPQEFGVLATVGRTTIKVFPRPQVAILSTGDEIVTAEKVPGPGQIRNGNGSMLGAQVARAGAVPRPLGIAGDSAASLRPLVSDGLKSSVLVLSGGVSAGKLDLVPGLLQEMGVEPHFHKVAMKPGKPVLFGTRGSTLVFGLPGNPVSSYVCFELFVRPALRKLSGLSHCHPTVVRAALVEPLVYKTDRPTYYPVRMEETEQGRFIHPAAWFGSPDLRGLLMADAFALIPVGAHNFVVGQMLKVVMV